MANDSQNTTPPQPKHETQGGTALDHRGAVGARSAQSAAQAATSPNAANQNTSGQPAQQPRLARPKTAAQQVSDAVAVWRRSLVELAGDSSLANVELLGDAVLNLTAAHPSGIAQLFAGRPTRLANIFREAASLPLARSRTRSVANHAQSQSEKFGISPTYLAIGVATWTEQDVPDPENDVAALARVARSSGPAGTAKPVPRPKPVVVRAPVLLRPISIASRSAESDFELSLEPSAEINPILARALRSRGALLDPAALARGAFTGAGFDPSTALDRINSLGQAVLPDFEMTDSLLVGTFVHPGQALVDDLDDLHSGLERHEIIAALAGSEPAIEALKADLPTPVVGDHNPNRERGVGDLDATARGALDALATGSHLFLDAPIGADTTGIAAAIIAEAAAIGRNILYVPGHRRAAVDLTARMRSLGLDDLLLDVVPSPNWRTLVTRRLLGAMTLEIPPLNVKSIADTRAELENTRTHLSKMVEGLHEVHEPWGISAYDALQALARLMSQNPAPSTNVRFDMDTLLRVASGLRARISQDLARIAQLDGFTIRPASTPWFGATLLTDDAAAAALKHVKALISGKDDPESLHSMQRHIERVSEEIGLAQAQNLEQWSEQLTMLEGMRGTLDQFQPMVFETSPDDLVAATASKQWRAEKGIEMSGVQRRRLVKRAKDMVRPGVRVTDLHESLLRIKKQRAVWELHSPHGGWPRLPEGFLEIQKNFAAVAAHLDALEPVLKSTPLGADLAAVDFDGLLERFNKLSRDARALDSLPERTQLLRGLIQIGLGGLLKDFTQRRVDPTTMDNELDLAWWASVFEQLLAANPYLKGIDSDSFERFAQRFRELDRAHVQALAEPIRVAAVRQNQDTLRNYRSQGEGLFTTLVEEQLTSVRSAYEQYTDVMRKLRPCMIATATMVPHLLPAHRTVDLVVLDAVQHMPVEQLLSAIARGRQVVVIGDPRCASGGAIDELSALLPCVHLAGDAVHRDSRLTSFLMKHGYADVLKPLPAPKPESQIQFEQVYGTGMPNPQTGAVMSTEVEVQRVVDLVIEHVLDRSNESLAVIAGSAYHAERIREALELQKRNNVVLANFFDKGRIEPAIIADLSEVAGLSRDSVIFSVGFGRTPHGRTLHRFGALSKPHGDGLLLNALGVTRSRLTVVSCFGKDDVDTSRLRSPGARMLCSLLDFAAGGSGEPIAAPEQKSAAEAAATLAQIVAGKVPARPSLSDDPSPAASNTTEPVASEQALVEPAGVADGVSGANGPEVAAQSTNVSGVEVDADAVRASGVEADGQDADVSATATAAEVDTATTTGSDATGPDATEHDATSETALSSGESEQGATFRGATGVDGSDATGSETIADPSPSSSAPEVQEPTSGYSDELDLFGENEATEQRKGITHNDSGDEPDRLLVDLADRLWQFGLTVETNFGYAGSDRIPLVAGHPDYPGEYFVAVLTDDMNYIKQPSLRARDRHRIERLESLGWQVVTLWSVPLFLDPVTQADKVREAVFRIDADRRRAAALKAPTPRIGSDMTDKILAEEDTEHGPQDMDSLLAEDDRSVDLADGATQPSLFAAGRATRPDVPFGLPINAYGDNQLDELVAWVMTDGITRDEEELASLVREELGIRRRSHRVDTAISNAIRRTRG